MQKQIISGIRSTGRKRKSWSVAASGSLSGLFCCFLGVCVLFLLLVPLILVDVVRPLSTTVIISILLLVFLVISCHLLNFLPSPDVVLLLGLKGGGLLAVAFWLLLAISLLTSSVIELLGLGLLPIVWVLTNSVIVLLGLGLLPTVSVLTNSVIELLLGGWVFSMAVDF